MTSICTNNKIVCLCTSMCVYVRDKLKKCFTDFDPVFTLMLLILYHLSILSERSAVSRKERACKKNAPPRDLKLYTLLNPIEIYQKHIGSIELAL